LEQKNMMSEISHIQISSNSKSYYPRKDIIFPINKSL